jgi:5-methylcytosine-specific restriction endonuclease McrA
MLKKVKRIKLRKQAYRRLMKRVLERDGWRCRKCGSLENLQVHHKIKRSQQGSDSLENLVTLCVYCHMAEHGQLNYVKSSKRRRSGENLAPMALDLTIGRR